MARPPDYRGRFAPSPTGPLHMGSLVAAVASYLDARSMSGRWLLRIEDIDPPREIPGAADRILRSLEAHGLLWDETVLFQSTRTEAYAAALVALEAADQVFACCCTRAVLGPGGSCLQRCTPQATEPTSLRLRLRGYLGFQDRFLGPQTPPHTPGDLALKRKDGLYTYALAVAVDDAKQCITQVVRGADLLSQTFAQLELLTHLGAALPRYGHLPLICDATGIKLSKQTGARGIQDTLALDNLRSALGLLNQESAEMPAGSVTELLSLATEHWHPEAFINSAEMPRVYPPSISP